jgi:hypothetical protein
MCPLSEKRAALLTAAMTAALLTVALVLPSSGISPFGEDTIQRRIVHEDRVLCDKFGLVDTKDPRSAECMADLAKLRLRHERLLVAYSLL